jgi:dUTP pyrophosphatase
MALSAWSQPPSTSEPDQIEAFTIVKSEDHLGRNAKLPSYAHAPDEGELGADLYSVESLDLLPGQIRAVSTGVALEFPRGWGGLIEDRSGLALKGVCTLAGVIDSGFRGELKVVLTNLGSAPYKVQVGDRIAQIRMTKCHTAAFSFSDVLATSSRGEGGFGSTGK